MIRASDLSPQQVLIVGMKGSENLGAYPVAMLSNMPGAVAMRAGNTVAEMHGAGWRPYAAESFWLTRTGPGTRAVYVQYRDSAGAVTETSALVPDYDPAQGAYVLPLSSAIPDPLLGGPLWAQDFAENGGQWASYDYNGGLTGAGNVFYPVSHECDEGGYIWTDASRWRIDTPENPHSILAMLNQPRWERPAASTLNMHNKSAKLSLRGRDLDLKGGSAFFWVLDETGRYHKRNAPLTIINDEWTENTVLMGSYLDGWHHSWTNGSGVGPMFDVIAQFGISFTDFPLGVEPTGRLEMRSFRIE